MRSRMIICAMAAMFLGMAGIAPARERDREFIMLSVDVKKIDLGYIRPVDVNEVVAKLTAHVVANCPHHVDVSFSPFKQENSNAVILPEHTGVTVNGKRLPNRNMGVSIVDSAHGTPIGGVDVPVEVRFGFSNIRQYRAGYYQAALMFTIAPRP